MYNLIVRLRTYLKNALSALDLTEAQATVYLCILENPEIDIAVLKSKTKYGFAWLYRVVNELIEKGFIEASRFPYTLSAVSLNNVANKISTKGRLLQRMGEKLISLGKMTTISPESEIFDEDDLINCYLDISYKIEDFLWCVGAHAAVMSFIGPEVEKEFIKNRIRRGKHADALIFDPVGKALELAKRDKLEKRETKYFHRGEYPLEFTYLHGDTSLHFFKDSDEKVKVIKTTSPTLARAQHILYQTLWNSSPE